MLLQNISILKFYKNIWNICMPVCMGAWIFPSVYLFKKCYRCGNLSGFGVIKYFCYYYIC